MENVKSRTIYGDLPGTREDSDLVSIYNDLKNGRTLSSLDAVKSNHTVNLTKYVSVLRKKYGIPVKDRWVKTASGKRVKLYWMD